MATQDNNTYVAIMAGGVGSRFWPGSREARPKQFLDMTGVGKSLLRLTFERFLLLCPAENIFIVTNAAYRGLVREQIPEISDNQILGEPTRNNTAPCIAYTALKLAAINPNATMVVAPSDHIVLQEITFVRYIRQAVDFCTKNDALVTLGIKPSRPDTGYGYIQFDDSGDGAVRKVLRFTEKPKLEDATRFVASGEYLWNAGIFIWKVASILDAFNTLAPEITQILGAGADKYNTAAEQDFINTVYPSTPDISVDFAIMEKADNVFTIPSDFGWSDLGTWASLHAECPQDEHHNVIQSDTVLAFELHNCLVRTPKGKLVVLKGLDNFIVVDEGDVLLVYPKSEEQEIKQVTSIVKSRFGTKFI